MVRKLLAPLLICAFVSLVVGGAFAAHDQEAWPYFVGFALVSTALLVVIWRWATPSKGIIIGLAILLRIVFSYLPPSLSDDAYRYVWDGVIMADGINPYVYKPSDDTLNTYQETTMYPELNSAEFYSVYPPVSQLVFVSGGFFYAGDWAYSYYIIKAVLSLLEIGALLILATFVSRGILLLYAWNPLVIVETAGQAHTEAALLFFIAACLWFVKKERPVLASAVLAFAGWVKLYPFVFFPLLWRRFGWKGVVPGGLVAFGLFVPFYHPAFFSNILESLNLYVSYFEFNAGLYYGIKKIFMVWTGDDWSKTIGPFLRNIFVLSLPVVYVLDAYFKWSVQRSFFIITVLFLILSTTIHPWYFLGILFLAAWQESKAWPWIWLGACSLGTYLLYIDGPYWLFVHLGWWGWLGLMLYTHREQPGKWLQQLQHFRAKGKVNRLEDLVAPLDRSGKVLDLGAGEGYVGAVISERWGAEVVLADVVNMNQTALPHYQYDGKQLPFEDGAFDTTILYFVLHHAEGAEDVINEALRVTSGRVIVVESVYKTETDLKVLTFLDVLANRIRSGGLMNAQEEFLHFRRVDDWKKIFADKKGVVVGEMALYSVVHQQHFFVLHHQE